MVNEPMILVKNSFFTDELQTVYSEMCGRVLEGRGRIFMACCGADERAGEYILYGTYPRQVIDARITGYENGIPSYETIRTDSFRVQRLRHKSCGHTHALLFDLFIPYQKYSLRFVLIHLFRYFHAHTAIEDYCLENDIPVSTFRKWLDWLRKSLPILTRAGLVRDRKEVREKLRGWTCSLTAHTAVFQLKVLAGMGLALFQRRKMPADYSSYGIRRYRDIPLPTDPAFDTASPFSYSGIQRKEGHHG